MRPETVTATPRIGYVIGRLDRALRREIGALVSPYGLTVPRYTALSILRDRPGLSNAQLARRTYVAPQSMNEVLMALEADGLIVRSRSAERDARRPRRRRARATAPGAHGLRTSARPLDRRPYTPVAAWSTTSASGCNHQVS